MSSVELASQSVIVHYKSWNISFKFGDTKTSWLLVNLSPGVWTLSSVIGATCCQSNWIRNEACRGQNAKNLRKTCLAVWKGSPANNAPEAANQIRFNPDHSWVLFSSDLMGGQPVDQGLRCSKMELWGSDLQKSCWHKIRSQLNLCYRKAPTTILSLNSLFVCRRTTCERWATHIRTPLACPTQRIIRRWG